MFLGKSIKIQIMGISEPKEIIPKLLRSDTFIPMLHVKLSTFYVLAAIQTISYTGILGVPNPTLPGFRKISQIALDIHQKTVKYHNISYCITVHISGSNMRMWRLDGI